MSTISTRGSTILAAAAASLAAALLLAACSPGAGGGPVAGRGTLVSGHVQSLDGRPVGGASVRVAGGGTALTDAQGRFSIPGVRPDERAAVWVTSDAYATSATAYPVRAGYETVANVDLIPRAPAQRLDAGRGGRVQVGAGGSLEIEPGSLVGAAGQPAQGDAFVSATYIDPADSRQVGAAPGNYVAADSLGRLQLLHTYGMVDVRVVDGSGGELSLARGRTASLTLPSTGAERGNAYRLAGGGDWQVVGPWTTVTRIPNVGTWNYDGPRNYTCLRVTVVPSTPGITVRASAVGWHVNGVTDATGVATIPVEPGTLVTIRTIPGAPSQVVAIPPVSGTQYMGAAVSCPPDGGLTNAVLSLGPVISTGTGGTVSYRASGLYRLTLR